MRKSLLTGILCFALLFANIYACGGGMKTIGDSKKAVATEVTEDDRTYEGEEKYETKKADAESQKEEGSSDGWSLILVNAQNPIPKSWSVSLKTLDNGQSIDERCYPDLQNMLDDCRACGLSPLICSSYRTWEKQESLFLDQVDKFRSLGYSQAEAEREAAKYNAVPGKSEHQLGLAVDIVDRSNQNLDGSQENTEVQKWLMKNSWKYGFILRYPEGKSDITGIIYEPWHYRYVGKRAAKDIYKRQICLEEYLSQD